MGSSNASAGAILWLAASRSRKAAWISGLLSIASAISAANAAAPFVAEASIAGPKVVEVLSGTTALTGASAFTSAKNIAIEKKATAAAP